MFSSNGGGIEVKSTYELQSGATEDKKGKRRIH